MQYFERDFEEFCKSPGVDSGKARSYTKAILYLFDYMEICEVNEETINKIKLVESDIKDKNSAFYYELLKFLEGRRQSSYLKKGFISAALKYLYSYNK